MVKKTKAKEDAGVSAVEKSMDLWTGSKIVPEDVAHMIIEGSKPLEEGDALRTTGAVALPKHRVPDE